jgi:inhibitor of cysteine peptidase
MHRGMLIEISDGDAPARRTLAQADELVLRLAESPTTGFRWQLGQSGTGELGLVDDRFVSGGPAPGAAGHRLIRFVARKPGQVRLEAVLRRAWGPADAGLQKRVFEIDVR